MPERSRCVHRGELHELVTTDHAGGEAGARIDRVGFLGFAEITQAGVIEAGDQVRISGSRLGTVLGFDCCHYPNHYNILIRTPRPLTATSLSLGVEDAVVFGDDSAGPS